MATFSDLFTHTRASTATYTDANGILQTAAINEPRTNSHYWNGAAWVKGYQHESEARTNLVTYSSDLTNTAWAATGVTKSTHTDNFYALTTTGSSAFQKITQTFTFGAGTYTFHFDVRKGSLDYVDIGLSGTNLGGAGFTVSYYKFDFLTSVLSVRQNGGASSTSVQKLGVDTYRISMTISADTLTSAIVHVTWNSNVVGVIAYARRPQLEAAPTPSSYIPTAGATVTRSADVMTLPIANIPYPSGSPLAVSIAMDGVMTYADTGNFTTVRFWDWGIDGINRMYGNVDTTGAFTGTMYFTQVAGGVSDNVSSASFSPGVNVPFSIASRHGSTFINGAVNGTALTADLTPVAFPDLSATNMQIAPTFNGFIHKFRMWGETTGDIGDTGIAEASAT